MGNIKSCGFCGEEKEILAKGLCASCYQRYRKNGTPEYTKIKHKCEITGCNDYVVSHGLCDKHRQRFRKHGSTQFTRKNGWGSSEKHPFYQMWLWRRRNHQLSKEWDDFWVFVMDIGERPSKDHIIKPIDKNLPLAKDNCMWYKPLIQNSGASKEAAREYAKVYRKLYPHKSKEQNLRKMFKIGLEDYDTMFNNQNGLCAICGEPETQYKYMPVDHCHKTGKIRGLLCSHCNKALGLFKENISILKGAIDYVNQHGCLA